MFSLTISFGPGPTMWTLMWRDKEKADAAYDNYAHGVPVNIENDSLVLDLTDDFGQRARIHRADIHGVMLEDMDQSKLAHIERALHQARTQAKGQEMASADSTLRAAAARQAGGPSILTPGIPGNGMFPR